MSTAKRSTRDGIEVRHRAGCPRPPVADETKCPCRPAFMASVYDARHVDPDTGKRGKRWRKTFDRLSEAKAWRIDARAGLRAGTKHAPSAVRFDRAAVELLARARRGAIRNRSGDEYKPSALRGYEQAFRLRLTPALGPHKLSDVTRADLQRLIGEWQAAALDPSTIRNTINAARVLYRHADELGAPVVTDPTVGLRLPAVRGKRKRPAGADHDASVIATPAEAARLLAALPDTDRALWATAFYAGLRRGELRGLQWSDVDLASGVIHVRNGWDQYHGRVEPKSAAGIRKVPLIGRLRDLLVEHKVATGRATGLVFGRDEWTPFDPGTVAGRARRAWGWKQAANPGPGPKVVWVKARPDALEPIGLHCCRHTYASLMIEAGEPIKKISTYMGHASTTITHDLYGHLLAGSEQESATRFDDYLDRADTAARLAQLDDATASTG